MAKRKLNYSVSDSGFDFETYHTYEEVSSSILSNFIFFLEISKYLKHSNLNLWNVNEAIDESLI